jgi:hypothetical protein
VPAIGNFGPIDLDTPEEAYTRHSARDGSKMVLVFSDEFNQDGRSFYPGDDPYWEAGDFHYWATNNMEWYDPDAVTTANGALVITFSEKETHGLHYQGGMSPLPCRAHCPLLKIIFRARLILEQILLHRGIHRSRSEAPGRQQCCRDVARRLDDG